MKQDESAGPKTILLVDDEAQMRSLLYTLLTNYGYNVIQAVDGQDALDKFELNQQCINLVVTDIVMPRMDGISSFKEMSKRNASVRVLYMSGYIPERPLPEGVSILLKPFSPLDFLQAVHSILGD
ncbi:MULTISPECIES: response regulator [Geomonas]|uniref:response regulator n=1 Tax=Geomonas TaxID=2651583 RepID=UPI001C116649|nr:MULTISPECIES: response regulator [Geomonas]MBU5612887.1 response regulator [Geomonas azotofigens]MBU5639052.1 response regulator [Geomonas diazotrophica]QXE85509.1 response regulator [Geomonas nitrogeniifigens]